MARALTTQEQAAWDTGTASTWIRAVVNDGVSNWELQDLYGRNWIHGLTYSDKVDNQLVQAVLTCRMKDGHDNLSPYDTNSRINSSNVLLDDGNTIKIYTAIMPSGTYPSSGDWQFIFDGTIEETEVSDGGVIEIRCHDLTEALTTAYIERTTTYAQSGSATFENVCNSILSDWASGTVTVDGAAITAVVTRYEQRREPVYSALRTLAEQIGYAVRYKWDSGSSTFKLYLIEPNRGVSSPDFTFNKSQWTKFGIKKSRKDIRNVVVVTYGGGDNAKNRPYVEVQDGTSISAHGRRWMELSEDESSQIDTATEATALATAALNELSEPTAYATVAVPYHYGVEIRDYVRLTADNLHMSYDLDLAVDGVSHHISQGGRGETTLQLSGKPKASYRRRLQTQNLPTYKRVSLRNFSPFSRNGTNLAPNGNFTRLGG